MRSKALRGQNRYLVVGYLDTDGFVALGLSVLLNLSPVVQTVSWREPAGELGRLFVKYLNVIAGKPSSSAVQGALVPRLVLGALREDDDVIDLEAELVVHGRFVSKHGLGLLALHLHSVLANGRKENSNSFKLQIQLSTSSTSSMATTFIGKRPQLNV